MTRYKIYLFDGDVSRYIKTLDDTKMNIQKEVDKLNEEYPEDDLIHGYGYYCEKDREY